MKKKFIILLSIYSALQLTLIIFFIIQIEFYYKDHILPLLLKMKVNYPKNFIFGFLSTHLTNVLTLLIFIVLSILMIFILILIFKQPIKILYDAVKKITEDDYDTKIDVKGKDELSLLYTEFNKMIKSLRKKFSIQKYVSKSTAKMVENLKTGEYTSAPQRKEVTIFFSDVRAFTTYSEKNDPLIVIETLNEIFHIQVEIITKYEGEIDKYIGDEIMASFKSPNDAFKAATDIQKKLSSFNKKREEPLYIGIGINYGEAVVGAIGAQDSYDWTAIGNVVNIAERLCSTAKEGEICLTEAVFEQIKSKREFQVDDIKVKGINKPIKVYIFKNLSD